MSREPRVSMPNKLQPHQITRMAFRSFILIAEVVIALGHFVTGGAALNHLLSGDSLKTGESLSEGSRSLVMQPDCNLVLYQLNPKKPIMNSNTQGKGTNCVLKLDTDGNLVIRNEWLNIMWQSGTARTIGSYVLLLQRNDKVVIYGTPIWNSGTKFTA